MKKLLFIAFMSLSQIIFAQQNITIQGTISGKTFTDVQLIKFIDNSKLSEAKIENNKFKISTDIQQEDIYLLFFDDQNYYFLDIKPKDNITYSIDFKDINNSNIQGSDASSLILSSQKLLRKAKDEDQSNRIIDSIVNANPTVLASVLFAMNLDPEQYADTHQKLRNSLVAYKENALFKEYDAQFKFNIGSEAPEIELNNSDGKPIKLSSTRGQYVLLDFWASWCGPCRGESPNLVAAYNNYHSKGFTIYSVSLDYTSDKWLKAISDDKLDKWIHVSDLKGWKCSAAQLYGISSIPANFLLDPQGKIVAKNLRGDALNEALKKIFPNK